MSVKKFKIFNETLFIVLILVGLKIILQNLGWEFLSTTPLHTGLLAGSVFVLGFILSSAHADYKESEKMPVELTTALESMYSDGYLCKQEHPEFNLDGLRNSIVDLLAHIIQDAHRNTDSSLVKAKQLIVYITDMEKLGLPANYIVKLKTEHNIILKVVSRMRYVQRIQTLPSAFILVESIVAILIVMMLLTKIGNLVDEITVTAFLSFIYIYLVKLIKVMDRPFHPEGSTQDDVSLFLLEDLQQRMQATPSETQ